MSAPRIDPERLATAEWLTRSSTQSVMTALTVEGHRVCVVGGAVRNGLLGEKVADIDMATDARPETVMTLARRAGLKAVPTGIEHGTVTVIAGGVPYEVTTLRDDVETDGRRARVHFGRDWKRDAERRDFTINALYATAKGEVVDLVGGLADIESRTIRFIGDAETRIREDYLRVLRFFRFFAWYGSGRPDAAGLKACARLKDGLDRLSAERVWAEIKKLLAAPDPSRALLWMRQASVLTRALPESEKWGIDFIHPLVKAEADLTWEPDPLLRLQALIPPEAERMAALAERLRLSGAEAKRLKAWAKQAPIPATTTEQALGRMLYGGDPQAIDDRLRHALAVARGKAVADDAAMMEAGGYSRLMKFAAQWQRPEFPLKGADLKELGFGAGPRLGAALKILEGEWIASGFTLRRDALLQRAATMAKG